MLVGLRLENIALLDSLELNFEEGLTVFTGETGAGKSILLDALDVLFGGDQVTPASRLLSHGEKRGQIEASFLTNLAVDTWLNEQGYDLEDKDLLISRELRLKDDRLINRCRINGILVNRSQIANLRPLLLDFTVQGQLYQLASPNKQLQWLDSYGKDLIQEKLIEVQSSWCLWNKAFINLHNAKQEQEQSRKKFQEFKNILEELEMAKLNDPFEDKKLQLEEDRLVNAVRLQQGLALLFDRLQENSDQLPSVLDHFSFCMQELRVITKLDSTLDIYENQLFEIQANLEELISNLNKYAMNLECNSSRLEEAQERLVYLKKLQKVYNSDLPHLLKRRDELRASLSSNNINQEIEELEKNEKLARNQMEQNNCALTKARQDVALEFEKDLIQYLRPLGLLNIRFKVQLSPLKPNENGADLITFLFSANPGNALAPLGEVASGGEMSRFLLALKTVLSNLDGSKTLFFDEIDSGVSGRVSGAVAAMLKDLSINRQVFCVTHQPLIAAVADHHFRVGKSVESGRTKSDVIHLCDLKDRQLELAELAGGDFAEARAYAASLLDHKAA